MPYVSTCIVIHGKENDVVLLCTQRQEEESADVLPETRFFWKEKKKRMIDHLFPSSPPSSHMTMLRQTMCVNYGVKNHCLTFLLTFINYFLKK